MRNYKRGRGPKPALKLDDIQDLNVNVIDFKSNTVTVIPSKVFVAEQLVTESDVQKAVGIPVSLSTLQLMVNENMLSEKIMEAAKWFLEAKGIK